MWVGDEKLTSNECCISPLINPSIYQSTTLGRWSIHVNHLVHEEEAPWCLQTQCGFTVCVANTLKYWKFTRDYKLPLLLKLCLVYIASIIPRPPSALRPLQLKEAGNANNEKKAGWELQKGLPCPIMFLEAIPPWLTRHTATVVPAGCQH